jgi:hypothetical protein
MKRTSLVIFLGALLVCAAQATTYVRVEKDGTKTYSDRPLAGGHPVDVQPAQTYSAPPTSGMNPGRPPEEAALADAANFHYECSLMPRNDETYTNPDSVSVALTLSPTLRYGDVLTFTMDGVALTGGSGQTAFSVPQPDRGSHTVTAHVVDRSGRTLCDTSTTFHVMRPSINSPTRRPPPTPPPRPTPH